MHLPKYNGEEVLKCLRSTERYAQIPVVVMTSSDAPADHDRAQKHAAMFYFRKPSRLDEFIQLGVIVRDILTRKKDPGSPCSPGWRGRVTRHDPYAHYSQRRDHGQTALLTATRRRRTRRPTMPCCANSRPCGAARPFCANSSRPRPIGLHWVGADGTILWANQAELDLLGYTREQYIGRNITEFHADEAVINDILACLSRGDTLRDHPARLRHRDGSIRHVLINSSVLFEDGKFVHTRCFTRDITALKQEQETRQAQLAAELADTKLLQDISAQLIEPGDEDALYAKIVDAIAAIMRSDFATMQVLYPERGPRGELRLLASRGLTPEGAKVWEWVRFDTDSTCGQVLRTGKRAIAADVETCDFLAGTGGMAALLDAGIHAAQSTPLFSRSGKMLGMISSHWRKPHAPTERDLRLLDILARQAADLIERRQADAGVARKRTPSA